MLFFVVDIFGRFDVFDTFDYLMAPIVAIKNYMNWFKITLLHPLGHIDITPLGGLMVSGMQDLSMSNDDEEKKCMPVCRIKLVIWR